MSDHLCSVRPLDRCEEGTLGEWTVLGNDTVNLANVRRSVSGKHALEFDKTNGAANTVHAGAYRSYSTSQILDLQNYITGYSLAWYTYVSSVADVDYTWVRIGTSASHYYEYRVQDLELVAGEMTLCHVPMHAWTSKTGNGADWGKIEYLAVGVAFDGEDDTLADIAIDEICVIKTDLVSEDDTEVDFTESDAAGSQKDSPYTSVGTSVVSLTAPAKTRSVTLMGAAAIRVGMNATLDGTANDGYDYLPAYQKETYPLRPGKLIYFRIDASSGTTSVYFKFNRTE